MNSHPLRTVIQLLPAGTACVLAFTTAGLRAQGTVTLPEITVYSPRVANQAPAGTFAMPVSALRYEPQADIHPRNLAEAQADVTIRGGIFENTGFKLGAVSIMDPQTGHYLAELPVAPAMLSAPTIQAGTGLAMSASNAGVGVVDYPWRAVRTGGAATVGFGEYSLKRAEIYQGFATKPKQPGGQSFGFDLAVSHSESDGTLPYGEHEFDRINGRLQRADGNSQTDLFAGYQDKHMGWPNMYTPFNSKETDDLQTVLVSLNHRLDLGGGQQVEAGAFYRRNKDDYAFNRFAALGPIHPFQHTTWISGVAASGRQALGEGFVNYRAEYLRDKLESTSLVFGRYNDRSLLKLAAVPEKTWTGSSGVRTTIKAGATFEDTNREGGAVSPILELAREFPQSGLRRVHLGYAGSSQVPTYTALNSNANAGLFRGNPNLGRAQSHNVELGGNGTLAGWTFNGALFWRRDEDLVDWTFRQGVTARTANAVDVDVLGLEVVARRSWPVCDLVLGYTALDKDADYGSATIDASFYALNYSRHRLTAAVTARLGGGFELRLDNVVRLQADNLLRVIGGDSAIHSTVALSYRPSAWRGLELALHVDNLWDDDFQSVPAVPASGRQFSASIGYVW